jgi:hypothetical protein
MLALISDVDNLARSACIFAMSMTSASFFLVVDDHHLKEPRRR